MSDSAARPLATARGRRTPATLKRQHRAAFFFLLPACALFSLCVIWPIIDSIGLSFYDWDGMTPKVFVGLANYIELFHADVFYVALKNNLIWLAVFLLAPPLGLVFALYVNQQIRGMRIVKSLFFAPFVLSGVVVGLVFRYNHWILPELPKFSPILDCTTLTGGVDSIDFGFTLGYRISL